jgi:hypothetical protein
MSVSGASSQDLGKFLKNISTRCTGRYVLTKVPEREGGRGREREGCTKVDYILK